MLTEGEDGNNLVSERSGDPLFPGLKGAALAVAIVYWDGLIYVGMQGSTNGALMKLTTAVDKVAEKANVS